LNKLIVRKIALTEEDLAYIKHILEGGARKETIEHLTEKGWNVDYWLKRRSPMSLGHREEIIKRKYKLGECTICRQISEYKIIQKIPDASVVSWYCEQHLSEEHKQQIQIQGKIKIV
jgi:hypothetical protein